MYVHECSGTGSSAPEHMRVRQQVADETVQFGRTHLSHKNHIPFYPLEIGGCASNRRDEACRRYPPMYPPRPALLTLSLRDRPRSPVSTRISSRNPRNHPAGTAGSALRSRAVGRRPSRTRYTRYPPPYDPPRGATCTSSHCNLPFDAAHSMFRCGGRCREVTRRVWHDVVKLIGV